MRHLQSHQKPYIDREYTVHCSSAGDDLAFQLRRRVERTNVRRLIRQRVLHGRGLRKCIATGISAPWDPAGKAARQHSLHTLWRRTGNRIGPEFSMHLKPA